MGKWDELVKACDDIPPCDWCGRLVLVGGPCCKFTAKIAELEEQVRIARRLQARESKSRAKLQAKLDTLNKSATLKGR